MDQVLESGSNSGSSLHSDEYKRTGKSLLPTLVESCGVFGDTQGPRPGLSTQVPPWLDKELVQQWMRPHYGAVCVTHCVAQSIPGGGDNYLSDMHRLEVGTSDGETRRFLVKCRKTEGYIARMLERSKIFSKEQQMYSGTMARLQDILHGAMPDDDNQLGPLCIHACQDFLVMEDLNSAGFRMLDRRVGLNLDQCLIVVRSLAKMHAASAVLHQRDPDSMKQYRRDFFTYPNAQDRWQKYFNGMSNTLAEELDTWSADWGRYAEKLRRVAGCLLALLQRARVRREGALNVLCHGDLWLNNILFSHRTPACRFVDFQFLQFTSPVVDVLFFLTTSPEFEVQAQHMSRLIQEYHSTLCDVLTKLGWSGVLMTLEELLADYKGRAAIMLWALIEPCPAFLGDWPDEFDFDKALETGSTPGRGMYNEQYKRLVKLLLPELDKMEVFDSLT
ncbi:uncharacterized protein [Periplaneta americana]|uniref:uncharacterized protein n=1 Tax=Periplaneta americana TaxID=6978 RepID=UPI0037E89D0C